MDEELNQNGVMYIRKELFDGRHNCSEGCDESIPIQNWWMEHSASQ